MNDDCPFCRRIAAREYDEEPRRGCYIFEPLNPVTPGHLLVVPGEHVRDASVAPATTAAVMFEAASKVQRLGGAANIITSIGQYATQTVYHLHVHIVPRREDDGLALPWTGQGKVVTEPAPAEAITAAATALHRYYCRTCGLDGKCKGEPTHFDISAATVALEAAAAADPHSMTPIMGPLVKEHVRRSEAITAAEMGTDARRWAQEFVARWPQVDEGLMLGWFANAIEAGRDAGAAAERERIRQRLTERAREMGYGSDEVFGLALDHLADFLDDLLRGDSGG